MRAFTCQLTKHDSNYDKCLDRTENTVGKGVMLVISIFSFSNTVFQHFLSHGYQKSDYCGKKVRLKTLKPNDQHIF